MCMKWRVAQGYREDNPAGDAIYAALPKNGGASRKPRVVVMTSKACESGGRLKGIFSMDCAFANNWFRRGPGLVERYRGAEGGGLAHRCIGISLEIDFMW